MTVRRLDWQTIILEGVCPIEDADSLLQLIAATPSAAVDWRDCDGAHTAVVQVLLASGAVVVGPPGAAILKKWVEPLLK